MLTDLGGKDGAAGVAIQDDGKIVATGAGDGDFALARYTPDGRLDASFGKGGKVLTDLGGEDYALAVAIQHDGKIVATGLGWDTEFALARYTPDGRLDASFGKGGKVLESFSGYPNYASAVAIQGDGKIVAAGTTSYLDFALARYTPDGRLDPSFGTGAVVETDFSSDYPDYGEAVAIQDDGKIVAAGDGDRDFALARYTPDGRLDASFGTGGKVLTDLGKYDGASAVAIQADGKIVAAGASGSRTFAFALARYTPDGRLDASFGKGGTVLTDLGGEDGAAGVAIQDDGKIVAAGAGDGGFALARYTPDGRLDASFGTGGTVLTDLGGKDGAAGVAIQDDGKIVAAGAGDGDFALARYLPNGHLD